MTVSVENFRLNVALQYAERGWHVFPVRWPLTGSVYPLRCSCPSENCSQIGKHPLTENGLWDATVDVDQIRQWWQKWPAANIGIATGAISGFVVLDIDLKSDGETSLELLQSEIGELPPTWEVRTGGGGTHYLFSHPGEKVWCGAGVRGWLKKPGLDMRGDGGYIVAAPSLHKSGNRYRWEEGREPDDLPISPMPIKLLGLMRTRNLRPVQPAYTVPQQKNGDDCEHWIGKAIARANEGSRNDVGYWLACQLRDADVDHGRAESAMKEYSHRVPQGSESYTEREAEATCRGVFRQPKRQPARSLNVAARVMKAVAQVRKDTGPKTASDELQQFYDDVAAGKVFNVPFPWPTLTKLADALLPGTITCICGDPGVGKTFWILQCLCHWTGLGHECGVFFIEKNQLFHTRRLLAQLEHDWSFKDFDWAKKPESAVMIREAMGRNKVLINELAACIRSEPEERVTLDTILEWVTGQAASGKRVIVVDPISAAAAGEKRWTADDDFMHAAQKVVVAYGSSLILVTHSKKGNRVGAATGHDMAAGAAYFRFSDTTIWLHKSKKPRKVRYAAPFGHQATGRFSFFFQLHKTREGSGSGAEIAFALSSGGIYTEQGIVIGESNEEEDHSGSSEVA